MIGGPGGLPPGVGGGPDPDSDTVGGSVGGGGNGNEAGGIMGGTGPLRFMAAARAAAAAAAAATAAGGCSEAIAAGFSGVDLGLPTLSTSETECEKDVTATVPVPLNKGWLVREGERARNHAVNAHTGRQLKGTLTNPFLRRIND